MRSHPVFMSDQHVEMLNRRLADSTAVATMCSPLKRDLALIYELSDGPDGGTVYWRTDFSRADGVTFSLTRGDGPCDVVISGNYWTVIDAVRGAGPMPTPVGDAGVIEQLMTLLTSEEMRNCAVPAAFPARNKR